MTLNTNDPVILSAVRTPFGKRKGALRETRPDACWPASCSRRSRAPLCLPARSAM